MSGRRRGDEWSEEKFQNRITIESLFLEYFSEEEFNLYIDKMQDAVASANMLMGFQTIPKLVSNNLAIFKEKIVNELPVLNELKYKEITEKGSIISKDVQILLNDDDTKVLHRNFKSRGGKFALIGKEKFAQSFITSEYLYRIFKEENVFDYTAVVCGYIKSIEQLCECIIFNVIPKIGLKIYYPVGHLNPSEITELCDLKELKKEKQWKVLMKEGNQKYFCKSLTMNQMFHFFEDN